MPAECQPRGWAMRRRRVQRPASSYVSKDAERRRNQLANLQAPNPGPGRPALHGGYAKIASARLDAKVADVFAALAEDAPLRDRDGGLPAADSAAVLELAETLCRLEVVRAHIRDFGVFDQATGAVRPAVELENTLGRRLGDQLDALGMTPRSRSRLGLDVARTGAAVMDLAQHWAQEDDRAG